MLTAVLGVNQAQALIAVGLIVLVAVVIWPAIPAVTAMALVTLGATRVTLQRLRNEPVALPLMLLHLSVYGGLYAIFVAASLHAISHRVGTAHQLSLPWFGGQCPPYVFAAIDLAVSTLPIALAMRQILGALRDDSLTA